MSSRPELERIYSLVKGFEENSQAFHAYGFNTRGHLLGTDTALSTKKLNQVLFYDPDDMVIGVESGMKVSDMQATLAKDSMELAAETWYKGSSVGGMIATNSYGPSRLFSGGLRDSVIGLEYINGFAQLVKSGGKVVKNVTGYDLAKMMIGSMGSLGPITSVNFKVTPKPADPMTLNILFDEKRILEVSLALLEKKLPIDFCQISLTENSLWNFSLGISGHADRQKRLLREIEELTKSPLQSQSESETDSSETPWLGSDRRHGFLEVFQKTHFSKLADLHLHIQLDTKSLLNSETLRLLSDSGATVLAHPYGADIHLFWDQISPDSQRSKVANLSAYFSKRGHLCVERCDATLRENLSYLHPKPSQFKVLDLLKKRCDPKQLFSSILFR